MRRKIPNRTIKSVRGTPSSALIAALEALGHHQAIPARFPHKVDLSRVSPMKVNEQYKGHISHVRLRSNSQQIALSELSLQTILSSYITHLLDTLSSRAPVWESRAQNSMDKALSSVFGDKELCYLHQKGYDAEDVMVWAWILTAESAKRATLRLVINTNGSSSHLKTGSRAVPTFVFMFLLRRKEINAQALKWLLDYAWDRLRGRHLMGVSTSVNGSTHSVVDLSHKQNSSHEDGVCHVQMNKSTILAMVVRLLRHARKVWPSALVSITAIVTTYVTGPRLPAKDYESSKYGTARLAFVYNRILWLLAQPASLQPFLSMAYQQRAQFDLLGRMATFDRPLSITREGYQAVIKVQLAHKKTDEERQWAEMKAKSWPPWKEERLGLDVVYGASQARSRALEVMTRMREAGYAIGRWEKVAAILAGQDTDVSPTIQTRAILSVPVSLTADRFHLRNRSNVHQISEGGDQEIWATRIRATRTVYEAWACFLAHADSGSQHSETIYAAMFEKLVFEGIRKRKWRAASTTTKATTASEPNPTQIYPGDGKEVNPAPLSPQEAVYVHCEPPSVGTLFVRMIKNRIKPSDRSLAFLVSRASSIEAGMKFLRLSGVRGASALANYGVDHRIREISFVSDQVFAAFIQLLCRSNQPYLSQNRGNSRPTPGVSVNPTSRSPFSTRPQTDPVMHALRLVDIRKPRYRPCWNALISALARLSGELRIAHTENLPRDIFCWKVIQEIVRHMQQIDVNLDWDGFQTVCRGLQNAISASIDRIRDSYRTTNNIRATASLNRAAGSLNLNSAAVHESDLVLRTGCSAVNSYFRELIGVNLSLVEPRKGSPFPAASNSSSDPSSLMPALLAVPSPSHLHAYMRVLGFSQDYEGILTLTRWMAEHATELFVVAEAASNGMRAFRRTLVSARVFLEQSWERDWRHGNEASDNCSVTAPQELLFQVKDIMDGVESWGGWPEDDEVALYKHSDI